MSTAAGWSNSGVGVDFNRDSLPPVYPAGRAAPADIYGLSLYAETDAHAQEIAAQINAQFPTLKAFQNEEWIDVARRGCSKGKGIELLKQQLSFKTIAGIGDSYNDIPLLRTTTPSFTFHSSPDAVKQEAQFLVDSLAEADCGYDADARGKTLIQDQDQGRLDKNIAVRKRKIRRFADFLFTSLFSAFVP